MIRTARSALLVAALLISAAGRPQPPPEAAASEAVPKDAQKLAREPARPPAPPDLSGRPRTGKASFYAKRFTGRKMADGNRMDPHADNAASKTLPLGTTAKVTNLDTGLSAEVTIQDRGPYVKGRIVDLSPTTAHEIGIDRHAGVARVVVEPIDVPLPNGGVKHSPATRDTQEQRQRPGETAR